MTGPTAATSTKREKRSGSEPDCARDPRQKTTSTDRGTCAVCGDESTGYHYKALACEGCKGFFRRSVDRRERYKCHGNGQCDIDRLTRNRCKACRFRKCLRVGMCPKAVRRDSQRHKRPTTASLELPWTEMEDSPVVRRVLLAHWSTYATTDMRSPTPSPLWTSSDDGNDLSVTGIFRVLRYCKTVPGFSSLCEQDQQTLLKHACIEIMVLRFCTRYFPESDGFHFPDGSSVSREATEQHLGRLATLAVDVGHRLISLSTDNTELALLQALCLLSSARPGLQHRRQVQLLEEELSTALAIRVYGRHLTRPMALHEMIQLLFCLRSMGRLGSQITLLSPSPSFSPI